jgi:RES domain-containing protein
VIIPGEHNVLINPLHPDFARLEPTEPVPFRFDPRLR